MAGDEFPEHPPKPRLTLRVGVTGKRVIPKSERERICKSLAGVFDALGHFLIDCHRKEAEFFSAEPPLLRIICGMAEGADQIAARIATKRYAKEKEEEQKNIRREIETRLAAILPFARVEFEKDFRHDPALPNGPERTDAEATEVVRQFEALLSDEAIESVLEINDEAILHAADPNDRDRGYESLRDVLLEHTDVLVAVSDDVDGGSGGTVNVIRIAVSEGISVIKISTLKSEIYVMRAPDPDVPDQSPKEDEELTQNSDFPTRTNLPKRLLVSLGRQFEPPASRPSNFGHGHAGAVTGRARLNNYFDEVFRPVWYGRFFRAFRDALAPRPTHGRRCISASAFFQSLRKYRIQAPTTTLSSPWFDSANDGLFVAHCGNNAFRQIHAARYAWADALAVQYADATRSSYVLAGLLGASAVLVGLSALFFPENIALPAKIIVLTIEGGLLAYIAARFFRPAHQKRWVERMIEYRTVAELLRHQRFMYAFGGVDRLERNIDRNWREPDAWIGWYVRATLRELGFPSVALCDSYRRSSLEAFQKQELAEQILYNRAVAERFGSIDECLSKIVESERLMIGAAFSGAATLLILYLIKLNHWCGYEIAVLALEILKPGITVLMAFAPLLIATIQVLRFQMKFADVAERAAMTERDLVQLNERVTLSLAGDRTPNRQVCMAFVRTANDAMSDDLAGWSNVSRGKRAESS